MLLRSRRVAPPEILGQVDDVAALASAEDLQHCVELGAQLGDLLIALCQQCSDAVAAGFASSIVLCPIAVGGASVLEWAPSGQYNHRLADALERLRKTDLWPTHVIWHQGEADALAGLPGERYRGAFLPFVMTCGKVASINPPFGPKRIGIRARENCGEGIGQ